MPVYEFLCRDCDARFDDLVSFDHALDQSCPQCRSGDVAKLYSPFSTATASRDAAGFSCAGGACLPGPAASGARSGGCCGGGCGGCGGCG